MLWYQQFWAQQSLNALLFVVLSVLFYYGITVLSRRAQQYNHLLTEQMLLAFRWPGLFGMAFIWVLYTYQAVTTYAPFAKLFEQASWFWFRASLDMLAILSTCLTVYVLVWRYFQTCLAMLDAKDLRYSASKRRLLRAMMWILPLLFASLIVAALGAIMDVYVLRSQWFRMELLIFVLSASSYFWIKHTPWFTYKKEQDKPLHVLKWIRSHVKTPLQSAVLVLYVTLAQSGMPWEKWFEGSKQGVLQTFDWLRWHVVEGMWLWFLAWAVLHAVKKLEKDLDNKSVVCPREVDASLRVGLLFLKALTWVVLFFSVLRFFNFEMLANSLFATSAVGTVLIGLAAREAIANVFGGMQVMFDRPFAVGDYILSSDKDVEGTVERIGWRMTLIRTPKRTLKYIPNSIFSTIGVENLSLMSNRRVRMVIGIRYQDYPLMRPICQDLEAYLDQWDVVDKRCSNFVTFSQMADSSINFMVNFYTKPISFRDYHRAVDVFMHQMVAVVQKHGADFPFPTRTLEAKDIVKALKARNKAPHSS